MILAVECLSKTFGTRKVLKGVTATFREGFVHGILGQNGSGKTVFLKILAGVFSPDEGAIHADGAKVVFASPANAVRAGIAYFPQIPYLPPTFNLDQIQHVLRRNIRGSGLPELLAEHSKDEPFRRYSLLEKEVVECQIALAQKPRVLLMDEPRFVRSLQYQDVWARLLAYFRREGITVIMTVHDLDAASHECDELHVFQEGNLSSLPKTSDLRTRVFGGARSVRPPPAISTTALPQAPRIRQLTINTPDRSPLQFAIPGISCVYGAHYPLWNGFVEESIADLQAKGTRLAVIRGDRPDRCLAQRSSIAENLELALHRAKSHFGLRTISKSTSLDMMQTVIKRFGISPATPEGEVGNLSGGNKQRLAFARASLLDHDCLICVNPWRGLDAAGIDAVTEMMIEEPAHGKALIVLTDDKKEAEAFQGISKTVSLNSCGIARNNLDPQNETCSNA
jgi:ABC-type sugar transport system ATPase subunit